jgi:hypothetical protein
MKEAIALLALFNRFVVGLGQPESCFVLGECLSSIPVGVNQVGNKRECSELCSRTEGADYNPVHLT